MRHVCSWSICSGSNLKPTVVLKKEMPTVLKMDFKVRAHSSIDPHLSMLWYILYLPQRPTICAPRRKMKLKTHTHTFRAHCIYIKWYLMSAISVGNHAWNKRKRFNKMMRIDYLELPIFKTLSNVNFGVISIWNKNFCLKRIQLRKKSIWKKTWMIIVIATKKQLSIKKWLIFL